MNYSSLALALFLPWLVAWLTLTLLSQRSAAHNQVASNLGFALPVGTALLYLLLRLQHLVRGEIQLTASLLALACLALALATAAVTRHRGLPELRPVAVTTAPRQTLWLALILLLLIGHLTLVTVEILYRPVYPWDAWLNWMYRAKAWFYTAAFLPMDSPLDWKAGNSSALYNVAGSHYPEFVPGLALWTALALGQWSDTLVNLPTLVCGVALALALYGECRRAGTSAVLALLAATSLISLPLLGSHLALAGQADIWMAAFTGLGFIKLIAGLRAGHTGPIAMGLLLILFSALVKLEGLAWFCVALLTLALARYPRLASAALLLAAIVASIAVAAGGLYTELPVLGGIGLKDDRVFVPLLGDFAVQGGYLLDDYWSNFVAGSSWHLLWPLLLLSGLGAIRLRGSPLRRVVPTFLAAFTLAQVLIFGFTEQGQWAEHWTAINRLPLHFAPALVFCIALVAHEYMAQQRAPGKREIAVPLLGGLALTALICAVTLLRSAGGEEQVALRFDAAQLNMVSGGGYLRDGAGVINRFDNSIAVVTTGPIELDARTRSIASVATISDNYGEGRFFWRRGDTPDEFYSVSLGGHGRHLINLSAEPEWRGQIIEVGLFFENGWNEPIHFRELALLPSTTGQQWHLLMRAWHDLPLWSQRSVHFLAEGPAAPLLSPALLMVIWLTATAIIALLLPATRSRAVYPILTCALLAWAALDARWAAQLVKQTGVTTERFSGKDRNYLDLGDDRALYQLARAALAIKQHTNAPVLLITPDASLEFEMLRTKYHLLPSPAYVHWGKPMTAADMGYELAILVTANAEPGQVEQHIQQFQERFQRRHGRRPVIVQRSAAGVLFAFEDSASRLQKRPGDA